MVASSPSPPLVVLPCTNLEAGETSPRHRDTQPPMDHANNRKSHVGMGIDPLENDRNLDPANPPNEKDPFVPREGNIVLKAPPTKTKHLPSPHRLNIFTIILASLTIVITTFSILFVFASTSTISLLARMIPPGYAISLNILRTVTEIAGLLLSALCDAVLEVIVWRLVSGADGLSLGSMLGISPSTRFLGLCRLLFLWRDISPADRHRFWACARLFLLLLIPVLKLVVTFHVEPCPLFEVRSTTPVSAGIAPFDIAMTANYVPEYLGVVATGQVWSLFWNPLVCTQVSSAINPGCSGSDCSSYYFTGGWEMISPNPLLLQRSQEVDTFVINEAPGLQGDFWNVSSGEDGLSAPDCMTWGNTFAAIMICVKVSSLHSNAFIAGMNICPVELTAADKCLSNTSWTQSVQISTSFSFSNRSATTAYVIANSSILSVQDFAQPSPISISATDLLKALDRFFSTTDLAAGQTSVTTGAINYIQVFLTNMLGQGSTGKSYANTWLREMLTMPLLLFQQNAMAMTLDFPAHGPRPNLPSNLYVTMDLTKLSNRIIIPIWDAIVYGSIAGGLCLLCFACLFWGLSVPGPNVSSFPLVDFATRVASARSADMTLVDKFAGAAATEDIKEHLQDTQLHLREIEVDGEFTGETSVKTLAFTGDENGGPRLNRESLYQW